MNQPTATVIVCVFNRPTCVVRCLDSLVDMNRDDLEIVLVDDASTDSTPSVLKAFKEAHSSQAIRIVRNEVNRGVSGSRNAGIRAARGKYVFFTDSDCTVESDWLAKLVGTLERSGAAAVAGVVVDPPPRNLTERAYHGGSHIGNNRLQARRLIGGNMGFRREIMSKILFDDALEYGCDEDDLAMRLTLAGHQVEFVPDAIVHHHHPLTLGSYLKMAVSRGKGSARFWYKRGNYIGRDLWSIVAALVTLPLGFMDVRWLVIPAVFALLQLLAILWNQVMFKGKRWWEALLVLPIELAYYVCRAGGWASGIGNIGLGRDPAICESKRHWHSTRGSAVRQQRSS